MGPVDRSKKGTDPRGKCEQGEDATQEVTSETNLSHVTTHEVRDTKNVKKIPKKSCVRMKLQSRNSMLIGAKSMVPLPTAVAPPRSRTSPLHSPPIQPNKLPGL